MSNPPDASPLVLPADALRQHWQGHRRLTRRLLEAFPEDQLFAYSIGGMRPFGAMVLELLAIAAPMVRGVVSETWDTSFARDPRPKAELLELWDESTATIDSLWPQIAPGRFQETTTAFGQYPGKVYDLLFYAIDNEVHHRAQGYVYLRALGLEPPPFYERG